MVPDNADPMPILWRWSCVCSDILNDRICGARIFSPSTALQLILDLRDR